MTFYADTTGSVDGQAGTAGELLPSVSIEAMLQRREALHAIVEQIGKLFAQADELAAMGGFGSVSSHAEPGRYKHSKANLISASGRECLQTVLDAEGWRHLLNESGLRSFMSAAKRKEWDEAIQNEKVPPLDRDTIAGTFAQLYESRGDMLEQGVIEVFRRLSWDYKTNSPVAFGKKIISSYAISMGSPAHRFSDELDDLLRVMRKLDGKPEADHRAGTWSKLYEAYRTRADFVDADEYVSVRMFRTTHTAHITFKRPDLVERMNGILAKRHPNALPAARH